MANDYFQFKRFTIRQEKCAMKVGTDGTLLGAWAHGGVRMLDIGTGTGLMALMMAQRYPEAQVDGIEIDAEACAQAASNVAASPFADRVNIVQGDVRSFLPAPPNPYDAILSNPPFYDHSLSCPDEQRNMARHTDTLGYGELMNCAWRLLSEEGEFSVVVPLECRGRMEAEASIRGFFMVRRCAVRTTSRKPPRRFLLAFRKHAAPEGMESAEEVLQEAPGIRSAWYEDLTKDFYL